MCYIYDMSQENNIGVRKGAKDQWARLTLEQRAEKRRLWDEMCKLDNEIGELRVRIYMGEQRQDWVKVERARMDLAAAQKRKEELRDRFAVS